VIIPQQSFPVLKGMIANVNPMIDKAIEALGTKP
jgi:hypothetical protein